MSEQPEYGSQEYFRQKIANRIASGEYVIKDGRPVCSTCGGNCGQCGNTETLGNIGFSFDTIVNSATTTDGRPSLRHPEPGRIAKLWLKLTGRGTP